jgi:RNase P/RNase MRP subunit POP5
MLAVDDASAYWRHVDTSVSLSERAHVAFKQRWFGTKSEARVRTIVSTMSQRFDAYPEALALLHRFGGIPAGMRTIVCHLHTQLADPVYRGFVGGFLPHRRDEGRATVDRATVARWVERSHPNRWSPATCTKFASNLLATAHDAGIVRERRDPRQLAVAAVPLISVGYALYLLRGIRIDGSLTENPYLRSLGLNTAALSRLGSRVPGVRVADFGGAADITFDEPTLTAWGDRYLGDGA